MTNTNVVIGTIYSYLNAACQQALGATPNEWEASSASAKWIDLIQNEGDEGHVEVSARYSRTGRPVTFKFTIVNAAEIQAACKNGLEEIPHPIYQY